MKLLLVIGTRPEAIKMAPIIKRLNEQNVLEFKVCSTGQHMELLSSILNFFDIQIDYNLNIMKHNQGLSAITASIIINFNDVIDDYKPDYVLVHGDTSTSFVSALSAFYCGVKIAHVEAGLRTFIKNSPFPEEMNRTLTARLSDIHFAPTKSSERNLKSEGIFKNIHVTGNTVIDALFDAIDLIDENHPEILNIQNKIDLNKRIVLFTGHRRENFGDGFDSIFNALSTLTQQRDDIIVIYPVHPNPKVKVIAEKFFKNNSKIFLINPLSYGPFIWLLRKAHIVLTDSGGIQEEAPSLGKPVLVLRDVTERPEAVQAGTVILVGTDGSKLIQLTNRLLDDKNFYTKMSELINPYGDGKASERIINYFLSIKNE